jgi:glutamate-ammonia-ligase adenylyltransferase
VKLSQAYRFLRELEHRLQYRNDAQTHAMPVDPEERVALAHAMGCDDYAALMSRLDAHREFVEQQFDQIFADKVGGRDGCAAPEDGAAVWVWSSALADDSAEEALRARLIELGVPEPGDLLARLRAVWQSSRYAGLAERSRQRFDIVAQRALEAARTLEPPERRGDTVARFFDCVWPPPTAWSSRWTCCAMRTRPKCSGFC